MSVVISALSNQVEGMFMYKLINCCTVQSIGSTGVYITLRLSGNYALCSHALLLCGWFIQAAITCILLGYCMVTKETSQLADAGEETLNAMAKYITRTYRALLTHLGLGNIAEILQKTFSKIFPEMKEVNFESKIDEICSRRFTCRGYPSW